MEAWITLLKGAEKLCEEGFKIKKKVLVLKLWFEIFIHSLIKLKKMEYAHVGYPTFCDTPIKRLEK